MLDVQVSLGKQHSSVHAKAALGQLLNEVGDKRPALWAFSLGAPLRALAWCHSPYASLALIGYTLIVGLFD